MVLLFFVKPTVTSLLEMSTLCLNYQEKIRIMNDVALYSAQEVFLFFFFHLNLALSELLRVSKGWN